MMQVLLHLALKCALYKCKKQGILFEVFIALRIHNARYSLRKVLIIEKFYYIVNEILNLIKYLIIRHYKARILSEQPSNTDILKIICSYTDSSICRTITLEQFNLSYFTFNQRRDHTTKSGLTISRSN